MENDQISVYKKEGKTFMHVRTAVDSLLSAALVGALFDKDSE